MTIMRRVVFLASMLLAFQKVSSQDFAGINAKLDKMLSERTQDKPINVDLTNKKFILIKESQDQIIRQIIEFKNEKIFNLVELYDNKNDSSQNTIFYNGDLVRNENILSVRADKKDGKVISLPETYNFKLHLRDGVLFLVNVNNNDKWIDTEAIQNKNL